LNFSQFEDGPETDHMKVVHYIERPVDKATEKVFKPRDSYFVMSWNYSQMFDHAFPALDGSSAVTSEAVNYSTISKQEAQKCSNASIIMSCATSMSDLGEISKKKEGVLRVNSPMVEGHILRPVGDGSRSSWTICFSCPISKESFAGLGATEDTPPAFADGTLGRELLGGIFSMFEYVEKLFDSPS
jgi:hypothetical protein